MKLILNLLTTTLLCLSLTMCNKDPREEQQSAGCLYDSSVEEMKKWYYFKTGTWWVYEEQTTGELDTITVYYDWAGTNSSGTVGFEWYATSSWDGYMQFYRFNDSYSVHCLSTEECTCHKLERARGRPGDFVGAGQIFLYPLIEENYSYEVGYPISQWTTGTTTTTDTNLEFVIGSDTLGNIIRWNVTKDQRIGGWSYDCFFA